MDGVDGVDISTAFRRTQLAPFLLEVSIVLFVFFLFCATLSALDLRIYIHICVYIHIYICIYIYILYTYYICLAMTFPADSKGFAGTR